MKEFTPQHHLTVDGKRPVTIEEIKIASLTAGVQTYVRMGILLSRDTTPEPYKARLRDAQTTIISCMGDAEIEELSRFRTWQGEQERLNRFGDPHEYEMERP